jgi:hypothetical protein
VNHPLQLFEVVALLEDVPAEKLQRGDMGTVVEVYDNGAAGEVTSLAEAAAARSVVGRVRTASFPDLQCPLTRPQHLN